MIIVLSVAFRTVVLVSDFLATAFFGTQNGRSSLSIISFGFFLADVALVPPRSHSFALNYIISFLSVVASPRPLSIINVSHPPPSLSLLLSFWCIASSMVSPNFVPRFFLFRPSYLPCRCPVLSIVASIRFALTSRFPRPSSHCIQVASTINLSYSLTFTPINHWFLVPSSPLPAFLLSNAYITHYHSCLFLIFHFLFIPSILCIYHLHTSPSRLLFLALHKICNPSAIFCRLAGGLPQHSHPILFYSIVS